MMYGVSEVQRWGHYSKNAITTFVITLTYWQLQLQHFFNIMHYNYFTKYEAFSLAESPHFWLKHSYTNWAHISFALDELICL